MTNRESQRLRKDIAKLVAVLEKVSSQTYTTRQRRIDAGYLSMVDAARLLGMGCSTLKTEIAAGRMPAPTHKPFGGKVASFSPADIQKMKAYVAKRKLNALSIHERRRQAGFYSRLDVCRATGLPSCSIYHFHKTGRVPPPTHPCSLAPQTHFFYTKAEYMSILKNLAKQKGWKGKGRTVRTECSKIDSNKDNGGELNKE